MKSVITSIIILAIIFFGALYVSKNQRNTLTPVWRTVDGLLANKEGSSPAQLKLRIDSLKSKRFVIELGLPGDDFDKVYYLLKSALQLSAADDKTLYYEKLEECKIYLESLIEYSKVNLASIL